VEVSYWWLVVLIPLMVWGTIAAIRGLIEIPKAVDDYYAREKLVRILTGAGTEREVIDHPGAIDTYLETEE